MSTDTTHSIGVSSGLVDAIRSQPATRAVSHCGQVFHVTVFDIYVTCPSCGEEIKVRSLAATPEIEDVFDAVFEWMADPAARVIAEERIREIAADT